MALHRFCRLEAIEDRHPGLCRQLEAMFKAFVPVRAIARSIRAQYGENIGRPSLHAYQRECWDLWREDGTAIHRAIGIMNSEL
jgi:hypothetical protein